LYHKLFEGERTKGGGRREEGRGREEGGRREEASSLSLSLLLFCTSVMDSVK
jgi:hypothetical protein